MPTNRRKRSRIAALDHWKVDQLVTGQCLIAGVGYAAAIPHGCNHWSADDLAKVHQAMRADWAIHGASIMSSWSSGAEQPWAFREWGLP